MSRISVGIRNFERLVRNEHDRQTAERACCAVIGGAAVTDSEDRRCLVAKRGSLSHHSPCRKGRECGGVTNRDERAKIFKIGLIGCFKSSSHCNRQRVSATVCKIMKQVHLLQTRTMLSVTGQSKASIQPTASCIVQITCVEDGLKLGECSSCQ